MSHSQDESCLWTADQGIVDMVAPQSDWPMELAIDVKPDFHYRKAAAWSLLDALQAFVHL